MSDLQVLGLCRWSYPSAPGAFRMDAGDTLAAIRDGLYAPERLNLRLFYLEHVVLPPLRAQTDPDFQVVMLLGDRLPEPWREQVLGLIADIPQITPVFEPEGQQHMEVSRKVVLAARQKRKAAVAEFWCDDDDAVAVDFVRRTRRQFRVLRPIFEAEGRLALDFNKGFLLKTTATGVEVEPVVARYWTPALAHILRADGDRTLANFHHMRMWQRMTMLCWPRQPMFIRGAHGQNDSSVSENPHGAQATRFDPLKLPEILEKRFAMDIFALQEGWARSAGTAAEDVG